MNSVEKMQD